MDANTLISPILLLIGGVAGYFLNYFLNKRAELVSEVNRIKRENYKKFVSLIIDLISDHKYRTLKNKPIRTIEDMNEAKIALVSKVDDFYKDYLLYASPSVINAYANYMQCVYSVDPKIPIADLKEQMRHLSKVIQAMRKDLGLSNKGLGKDGENVLRAKLPDFDLLFKE